MIITSLVVSAALPTACLNKGPSNTSSGSTSSTSTSTGAPAVGGASTSADVQCAIFSGSTRDLTTCLACKTSLCPCTKFDDFPNQSVCLKTELSTCTADTTRLVQCVHDNLVSSGGSGSCTGLKCGTGQIADLNACLCKDATPPTSIIPAPGQDDTLTPFLEPGFFIGNRLCPTSVGAADQTNQRACLSQNGKINAAATNEATVPTYTTIAPVNIFQDVGYIRWDLALDASQFGPAIALDNKLKFNATWATFPATLSFFYQLKPNTQINPVGGSAPPIVPWTDCAEHFSGWNSGGTPGAGTSLITSNGICEPRVAPLGTPSGAATGVFNAQLDTSVSTFGTSTIQNLSMNGPAANANMLLLSKTGNNPLLVSKDLAGVANDKNYGLRKQDNVSDATTNGGLFSNIGYYKYSFGPLRVARKTPTPPAGCLGTAACDVASGTVTGRIAVNMNLGYTPTSAVESTAFSPAGISGTVPTRDCANAATSPNPCVVTSVYRAPGGAIMSQTYSPQFGTSNDASTLSSLPGGLTAVSTPKIIEEQLLDISTGIPQAPARLRVFARGDDGNIYMSRGKGGSWSTWMSLGRPWTCDPNDAAHCNNMTTSGPPVYAPMVSSLIAGNYSGKPGDGISIASEPVVVVAGAGSRAAATAPFYPPFIVGDTNRVINGAIAVFVRVSHLNSSDGAVGGFHNAVFYTYANIGGSTPLTAGQTHPLDNPRTWSQWMPVRTAAGDLFKIQGNPTAIAKDFGTVQNSNVAFYVFGTATRAAPNNFHAPIAPGANSAAAAFAAIPTMSSTWFNYGNSLISTAVSLNFAAFNGGNPTNSTNPPYSNNEMVWENIQTTTPSFISPGSAAGGYANPATSLLYPAAVGVFSSDWAAVPVSTALTPASFIDRAGTVRLLATALVANENGDDVAGDQYQMCQGTTLTATNIANPVSPCVYERALVGVEFTFITPAAVAGVPQPVYSLPCGANGILLYPNIKFIGGVSAVNLSEVTALTPTLADPAQALANRHKIVVLGRAVCPAKNLCDNVNPTLAYAVINELTECGGATSIIPPLYSMYYNGGSHIQTPINTGVSPPTVQSAVTSNRKVQTINSTSDVMATFSFAKRNAGFDVPVYIQLRNSSGNMTSGFFNSASLASSPGSLQWEVFPTGGPMN